MPQLLNRKYLYNDNTGYIDKYDFSQANLSHESRVKAITTIASVCYNNPKAIGSESLYNRLAMENKGLPSSSYEFVPVLIDAGIAIGGYSESAGSSTYHTLDNCVKYGEFVENNTYLLTNLRALIEDLGNDANQFYNTEKECSIIAKHFKVFKSKVPLFIARQYMRHRCSWQELSRRYVSGNRSELEFYTPPRMKQVLSKDLGFDSTTSKLPSQHLGTKIILDQCVEHYYAALESGIKPEVARTILPVSLYTTVWSAWQPKQLEVFFKLRDDPHAQKEIQELARAKKDLVKMVPQNKKGV